MMGLFVPPLSEKMKAKRDIKGLIKTLGYTKTVKPLLNELTIF
jgi:hypothetical protein